MNFIILFLFVIVWMMSLSASSLASAKRCTKIKNNTSNYTLKGSQKSKDTYPSPSDKTSTFCTGSISVYGVPFEETIVYQSYSNIIVYTGFLSHITFSGFYKQRTCLHGDF